MASGGEASRPTVVRVFVRDQETQTPFWWSLQPPWFAGVGARFGDIILDREMEFMADAWVRAVSARCHGPLADGATHPVAAIHMPTTHVGAGSGLATLASSVPLGIGQCRWARLWLGAG